AKNTTRTFPGRRHVGRSQNAAPQLSADTAPLRGEKGGEGGRQGSRSGQGRSQQAPRDAARRLRAAGKAGECPDVDTPRGGGRRGDPVAAAAARPPDGVAGPPAGATA